MGRRQGRMPAGYKDKRRSWSAAALLPCLGILCSLAPVGCGDLNRNTNANGVDPLLGGPPLRPVTQAAAPQPQSPQAPAALLPPTPVGNATLSTAALAAGTPRPMDTGRDLRIGSPGGTPSSDAWASQPSPASPPGSAVLQRPELTAQPASQTQPAPTVSPASMPSSSGLTKEQAQAEFKARGVLYQQSTYVEESREWQFRCSLPSRQNPRIRHSYIGRGPDELSAMRAVLEQIDKEP